MMNHIYNSFMLMPHNGCDEIDGFLPETSGTSAAFPIFRIVIQFKKSIRRKLFPSLHIRVTGIGSCLLPFELMVVRTTGLRITTDNHPGLTNYSFCIDERIYYRRLICRPSLGLSPPLF